MSQRAYGTGPFFVWDRRFEEDNLYVCRDNGDGYPDIDGDCCRIWEDPHREGDEHETPEFRFAMRIASALNRQDPRVKKRGAA